jgi:hypothetical protein
VIEANRKGVCVHMLHYSTARIVRTLRVPEKRA